MGCVQMHQKIPRIEGWGNPSRVWCAMEKIGKNNWKARKTSRTINQVPTLGLKHDKIWAWWALNISLENMLFKGYDGVDTFRWNLEVEPFVARWIVQMEKDMHGLGALKDHMLFWGFAKKEMCCCQLKVSRRKGFWSTINLIVMI